MRNISIKLKKTDSRQYWKNINTIQVWVNLCIVFCKCWSLTNDLNSICFLNNKQIKQKLINICLSAVIDFTTLSFPARRGWSTSGKVTWRVCLRRGIGPEAEHSLCAWGAGRRNQTWLFDGLQEGNNRKLHSRKRLFNDSSYLYAPLVFPFQLPRGFTNNFH